MSEIAASLPFEFAGIGQYRKVKERPKKSGKTGSYGEVVDISLPTVKIVDQFVLGPAYTSVENALDAGDVSMYDHLVKQRDSFERIGMWTGVSLSLISICASLLFNVPWGASAPASVMLISLTGFMALRRLLRGGA